MVGAGLECHVGCGASRQYASFRNGLRLGMRPAAQGSDPTADDDTILTKRVRPTDWFPVPAQICAGQPIAAAIKRKSCVLRRSHPVAPPSASAFPSAVSFTDQITKVLRISKVLVNRCVTNKCHMIDAFERLKHHGANFGRGNLRLARTFQLADNSETARSTRSSSTAVCEGNLKRNGEAFPCQTGLCATLLDHMSSRNCTRSNVVKRPPQSGQCDDGEWRCCLQPDANPSPACLVTGNKDNACSDSGNRLPG